MGTPYRSFSGCPDEEGITTLRRGEPNPQDCFSGCPDEEGITTRFLPADGREPLGFSGCPDEEGITTALLRVPHLLDEAFPGALMKKGLRPFPRAYWTSSRGFSGCPDEEGITT